MRVAGIDPGPKQSALVITDGARVEYMQRGNNRDIAWQVSRLAQEEATGPDLLAIEVIRSSYSATPIGAEVFDTAIWAGRFMGEWLAAGRHVRSVVLLPRITIRTHLCGAKGNDTEIRRALIARLGKEATKGVATHEWAALAAAVTARDRMKCGLRGVEAEMGVIDEATNNVRGPALRNGGI